MRSISINTVSTIVLCVYNGHDQVMHVSKLRWYRRSGFECVVKNLMIVNGAV